MFGFDHLSDFALEVAHAVTADNVRHATYLEGFCLGLNRRDEEYKLAYLEYEMRERGLM